MSDEAGFDYERSDIRAATSHGLRRGLALFVHRDAAADAVRLSPIDAAPFAIRAAGTDRRCAAA